MPWVLSVFHGGLAAVQAGTWVLSVFNGDVAVVQTGTWVVSVFHGDLAVVQTGTCSVNQHWYGTFLLVFRCTGSTS